MTTPERLRLNYAKWKRLGCAAGLICFAALFYFASSPVNRTEAEDAYDYAWRLENQSGLALLDAHHLFYLPLAKVVSKAVTPLVPQKDSLGVLCLISSVATAFMLFFFFRLLHLRMGFRSRDALLAAMVTGVSYGIWRYAAEAEIYGLSGMFAVWLLSVSLKADGKVGSPVASAFIAVAGTCIHIMNILPAFAVGVVCLCQRRWKVSFVYGMVFVSVLLAVFGLVMALGWDPLGTHGVSPFAYKGSIFTLKSYPRALVGIGSGLLSSQFIFAFEFFSQMAAKWFPGMNVTEEVFFGQVFGPRLAVMGTVLIAACLISTLWLGFKSLKGWRLSSDRSAATTLAVVSGIWFLLYAVIVFRYDPAAPEFWVQALPAVFLLLFSLLAIGGLFPSVRQALALFFFCTVLHNGLTGILPLKYAGADYNAVRAEPLLEQVDEGDLVLCSDNSVFYRYLRYNCPCEVVYLYTIGNMDDLRERMADVQGRVYAFDDLGDPPSNIKLLYPEQWYNAKKIGIELRGDSAITIVPPAQRD
jgi:hypothetical protein